jgi:hypothetical protein
MQTQRPLEVIDHASAAQPAGLNDAEHPLGKAAARLAVTSETLLTPLHRRAEHPLGVVVIRNIVESRAHP